jgi:hypothetical protein
MEVYGKQGISRQEQDRRSAIVRESLALVRLDDWNPGSQVLAAYDCYIQGDVDWEACEKQIKKAAIIDARERMIELEQEYLD